MVSVVGKVSLNPEAGGCQSIGRQLPGYPDEGIDSGIIFPEGNK